MDSLALRFGKAICQSSTRLGEKMMKANSAFGSDALRLPAWLWGEVGGLMGFSVSVNGVPVPSPTRWISGSNGPMTGAPGGSPGRVGGWNSGHCAATLVQ